MSIEETIEQAVQRAVAPLHVQLAEIKQAVCHKPDETPVSDEDAAKSRGVSIATIRRMKKDGRIGNVLTPKGRMVRKCDL